MFSVASSKTANVKSYFRSRLAVAGDSRLTRRLAPAFVGSTSFTRFSRRRLYSASLFLLLLVFALSACAPPTPAADDPPPPVEEEPQPAEGTAGALEPNDRNGMYDDPPEVSIDSSKTYHAIFKTEKGDMRIRLFAEEAPMTVNNFIFLARDGFYNDTQFHRVLENFMAQGGDPTGTGAGGPGYQFQDEFVASLQFDRAGLLAMANAGPNTNGSQFFITFAETPWLNGNHTIFGEIVEGMDVLMSISLRDPMAADSPGDLLETVEIEESE